MGKVQVGSMKCECSWLQQQILQVPSRATGSLLGKPILHSDCANGQGQVPLAKDHVYVLPAGDSMGGLVCPVSLRLA
jgi:hypothetical protein